MYLYRTVAGHAPIVTANILLSIYAVSGTTTLTWLTYLRLILAGGVLFGLYAWFKRTIVLSTRTLTSSTTPILPYNFLVLYSFWP